LRSHGLSDQQWRVLRVLGEDHGNGGNGVETGRIGREAFITGPSLSGVLTRMERDGLVQRQRDASDQRRTVVSATALGLQRVDTLSHTIEAHYQTMEQHLGKTKLAQLYALLDEVIALDLPPAG
jgi:homoprotocatechuate degradation regulator HpaR